MLISLGIRDYGLGRHLWTLTPDQFVKFNKVTEKLSLPTLSG